MELGILKTVRPRQKWINEERDFTPWLADNIGELNKALTFVNIDKFSKSAQESISKAGGKIETK